MKEKILKLRDEGKTYNEIKEILGCSKGTISYHCGEGQKEKTTKRRKRRRENVALDKLDRFKYAKKPRRNVCEQVRGFNKVEIGENGRNINKEIKQTFNIDDVLEKFGENTICYLSGEKINLYEKTYNFDHIIPVSRGGDNSLENLGITHEIVNYMKGNLMPDELLYWCKKILEHNGYKVENK